MVSYREIVIRMVFKPHFSTKVKGEWFLSGLLLSGSDLISKLDIYSAISKVALPTLALQPPIIPSQYWPNTFKIIQIYPSLVSSHYEASLERQVARMIKW